MKFTAIVEAKHLGDNSITHQCDDGQWLDPIEGFRFTRRYKSTTEFSEGKEQLKRDVSAEIHHLAEISGHCRCKKLLRPIYPKWATDIGLIVTLQPEGQSVGFKLLEETRE